MPRPKTAIPKYRKHSSGQARVTINGRDYLLGPHGTQASKDEYDRVIAEYLTSGRARSFGAAEHQLTVAMLMADYLDYAKAYYGTGETSEWHRFKLALRPMKALYAGLPAVEFGPTQFKAVRQRMITNGLSRLGINAHMKRIVRMFKWGASEGKLPVAVHETLRVIPGLRRGRTEARETDPVKPVSKEVVDATIEHLPPVVADMVRSQLLIGCRPGEICQLTPAMIDRKGQVWTAVLDKHKTAHHGHGRTLYIGPKAQAVLAPYLLREPDERLFRPIDAVKAKRETDHANRKVPLHHGNRPGKSNRPKSSGKSRTASDAYKTTSYAKAIRRAADKAGVEHWSPNQLRHTRGTEIRSRFGLDAAAVILGHTEVAVTQVYAEQDRQLATKVARKIG